MFQDFAKKKYDDYLALLEFPAGRISFNQIRTSTLPPFIVTFFEHYVPKKNVPLNKKDFEEILNKAIIFNINYIIKPKNTILKFLFGDVETRPVHFIRERLKYFQFYGYYVSQIEDFIAINGLEVVASSHVEHLISEINKRLLEEISQQGSEQQRMNLVKLLYYFFHDLGDNNPINIKIPQKILSVYFGDKGYYDIKRRVDNFFSDEIFIQEALVLMDPETRRAFTPKSDVDVSDDKMKEIITKAKKSKQREKAVKEMQEQIEKELSEENSADKENPQNTEITAAEEPVKEIQQEELSFDKIKAEELAVDKIKEEEQPVSEIKKEEQQPSLEETIDEIRAEEEPLASIKFEERNENNVETGIKFISLDEANEDVEKMLQAQEEMPVFVPVNNISADELKKQSDELRKQEEELRKEEAKLPVEEVKKVVIDEEIYSDDLMFASQFSDMAPPKQVTEKEIRTNIINDLFCEESYRKKIIKNIFKKDTESFSETVGGILKMNTWNDAIGSIDTLFKKNKVKYYSDEAIKFVDVLQEHFDKKAG